MTPRYQKLDKRSRSGTTIQAIESGTCSSAVHRISNASRDLSDAGWLNDR
jgi:hypothetical protein